MKKAIGDFSMLLWVNITYLRMGNKLTQWALKVGFWAIHAEVLMSYLICQFYGPPQTPLQNKNT